MLLFQRTWRLGTDQKIIQLSQYYIFFQCNFSQVIGNKIFVELNIVFALQSLTGHLLISF